MLRDISAAYGLSLNLPHAEAVSSIHEHHRETENTIPYLTTTDSTDTHILGPEAPVDAKSLHSGTPELGEEDCTSEDGLQVTLVALNPGSLLTLELVTDSGNFDALVDTGASVSLIKLSVAEKCGFVEEDGGVFPAILGLGGTVINPVSIMDLTFTIDTVQFKSQFTVVADNCLTYDIVLGGDFYMKHGLSVDINKRKISKLTNCGSWKIYLNETPSVIYRDLPVYLVTDIKLNSTEPVLVDAEVRGILDANLIDEFYYDGFVDDKLDREVFGYQGVVNLCKDKTSV